MIHQKLILLEMIHQKLIQMEMIHQKLIQMEMIHLWLVGRTQLARWEQQCQLRWLSLLHRQFVRSKKLFPHWLRCSHQLQQP